MRTMSNGVVRAADQLVEKTGEVTALASQIRREIVHNLRLQGLTFAEIGKRLGISRARAHQLWREAERKAS